MTAYRTAKRKATLYFVLILAAIVGSIMLGNAQPTTEKVYLHVYTQEPMFDVFCGQDDITLNQTPTVFELTTTHGTLKLGIISKNLPYDEYLCDDEQGNKYIVRRVIHEAKNGKGIMFLPMQPNMFTYFIANIPNCEDAGRP